MFLQPIIMGLNIVQVVKLQCGLFARSAYKILNARSNTFYVVDFMRRPTSRDWESRDMQSRVIFRINPRRYFQNENNIRIMPFHLRAVWNATRNKTAPGYRDVITVSLCARLRALERGEKKRDENDGADRANQFPKARNFKSRRRIYPDE